MVEKDTIVFVLGIEKITTKLKLMDQVCGMAEVFARSMRIATMMMILSYSFQKSWMLYISPELARIIGRMILIILCRFSGTEAKVWMRVQKQLRYANY